MLTDAGMLVEKMGLLRLPESDEFTPHSGLDFGSSLAGLGISRAKYIHYIVQTCTIIAYFDMIELISVVINALV